MNRTVHILKAAAVVTLRQIRTGKATARRHLLALSRAAGSMHYACTEGRRLRPFKASQQRGRCFILGSGPSVNAMDLTRLREDFTFCLNAFVLHTNIDQIDPKCYICCNPILLSSEFFQKEIIGFLRSRPKIIKVFDYAFSKPSLGILRTLKNVYFMKFNQGRRILSVGKMFFDVTRELPASDATVLIQAAIPLAAYMGFSEIYLVGCDCDYDQSGKRTNHFYRENKNGLLWNVKEKARALYGDYWQRHNHHDVTMKEYAIAKRSLEEMDIRIMNAGIGGRLDVIERVPFSDLVP